MHKTAILTNAAALAFMAAAPKGNDKPEAKTEDKPLVVSAVFTLPQPERKTKRGSVSQFPFDSLTTAGMAFGVKGRNVKSMSQIISNQNKRAMQTKTDEAGNPVPKIGADGNPVYKTNKLTNADGSTTTIPTTELEYERVATKRFYAFDITKEYAENLKGTPLADFGVGDVLVFREI